MTSRAWLDAADRAFPPGTAGAFARQHAAPRKDSHNGLFSSEAPMADDTGMKPQPRGGTVSKVRITVQLTSSTRDVDGYTSDVPGLVVHRGVDQYGPRPDRWVVTHASGVRLPGNGYRTRADALAAARRLGELEIDWTADRDTVQNAGRKLLPEIREAIEGV